MQLECRKAARVGRLTRSPAALDLMGAEAIPGRGLKAGGDAEVNVPGVIRPCSSLALSRAWPLVLRELWDLLGRELEIRGG